MRIRNGIIVLLLMMSSRIIAQTNTFPASGNVGIGTVSPYSILHVNGSNSGLSQFSGTIRGVFTVSPNNYVPGQIQALDFLYAPGSNPTVRIGAFHDNSGSKLIFGTSNNYASGITNSSMVIDANGNVGIGTSVPNDILEIKQGVGWAQRITYTPDGSYLRLSSNQIASFTSSGGGNSLYFNNSNSGNILIATGGGNVGIGTINPTERLSVNGNIRAKKLIVTQSGWPDYVFSTTYKLRTINELANYLVTNKHLPDMPSAKDVEEKGLDIGKMQSALLKKIEELTLYIIKQDKKVEKMQNQINQLKKVRR
jgi:hypothetical protein